ncbi:glycosyltransferase family 4 protein [Sphingomonas colocasiae]|uniref:glycosyltransferase family 4 protein n=1 Tax=Sphingomonas colocasiae TaxID=1848973 RepID=UPI001FE7E986|nr:glycosyltransferase family 4 protein [Sphingomonas colocasiae]
MKIAISINTSWNVVNFRAGLVRALVAQGHEVIALTPTDAHSARIADLGARFIPLEMDGRSRSPLHDIGLALRYRAAFRRERPDVYLGFTIKPNLYGSMAAHSLGIPVVNNITGLGKMFVGKGWLNRVVIGLYRVALSRSRTVFFQNRDDLALFAAHKLVADEVIRLLPGSGVDLQRFKPAPRDEAGAARPFTFLLIARLLWAKGIAQYIEAARQILQSHPDTRFRIVGMIDEFGADGVPRSALDQWQAEGVIDYLGPADDVRPHIADADCLVLPTYYPEGTPRTLLEGAAMGKPLLTTDVPGCRDIVEDRVTGRLCAPRDVAALHAAMSDLRNLSPAALAEMGIAARNKAERDFDEQIVVRRYLDAIDDAVRNRR